MASDGVEVGQTWKAKAPGKERVEVKRVWPSPGADDNTDFPAPVPTARCHPVHGGKPLVIAVADLRSEFVLEEPHTDE